MKGRVELHSVHGQKISSFTEAYESPFLTALHRIDEAS